LTKDFIKNTYEYNINGGFKMNEDSIKINNYSELLELLYDKFDICDVLIDFHNRKKWIASTNITATLIENKEGYLFRDFTAKKGEFIRRKEDNSILYVCNAYSRYEYFIKDNDDWFSVFSNSNISNYISRDLEIILLNKDRDLFIDNGKAKEAYIEPITYANIPYGDVEKITYAEMEEKNGDFIFKPNETINVNPFIIEKRKDGGLSLLDKNTKILKYVCNIGKRYEYYFKGEYSDRFSSSEWSNNDLLIYLKPDKENIYIPVITMINPTNNPYIVLERKDGGVDLISKKDNTLKYICNIGKRFYYRPCNKINLSL
jgi:hypothetical protein